MIGFWKMTFHTVLYGTPTARTVYPYSVAGEGAIGIDVLASFQASCQKAGLGSVALDNSWLDHVACTCVIGVRRVTADCAFL